MNRHSLLAPLAALAFIWLAAPGCATRAATARTGTLPNDPALQEPDKAPSPPAVKNDRHRPVTIIRMTTPLRPKPKRPDMKLFWEVWDLVYSRHITSPIDRKKMMEGAIRGMITATEDKHSHYITPEGVNDRERKDTGSYCGIGATLSFETGELVVTDLNPKGPAKKAGLKPGDVIVKVNGKLTKPLGLRASVQRIIGKKGTQVRLLIRRPGRKGTFVLTIVRAKLKIYTVETELIKVNALRLAHIRLTGFTRPTAGQFRKAIAQAKKWKVDGVLLDLRGNPGGYVSSVQEIASAWLGSRTVMLEQDATGNQRPVAAWASPGIDRQFRTMPTVVLIDKGSASASEILAGALKDYRKAILVGTTSYGKGSVQLVHPLGNGGALALTIRLWLTPNGDHIHGKGIKPDHEVTLPNPACAGKKPAKVKKAKSKTDPFIEKGLEVLVKRIKGLKRVREMPEVKRILDTVFSAPIPSLP